MTNLTDIPKTPNINDEKAEKTAAHERVERIAERAAEKAGKAEQGYDDSHTIFTK